METAELESAGRREQRHRDDAIEALLTVAAGHRGLVVRRADAQTVTITVGTTTWTAVVIARDVVSEHDARALTAESRLAPARILVTRQLSAAAKDVFAEAAIEPTRSWSWLDRRGELVCRHADAIAVVHFGRPDGSAATPLPVRGNAATPVAGGPIRGRAGVGLAAYALLSPERPGSIRDVARAIGMSHGAVGAARQLLRDHGLIRPDGRAACPELFNALARVWQPPRICPVRTLPTEELAHRLGSASDPDSPGWCVGGDSAAAAWGAAVVSSATRPWIWVPELADARRAERALEAGTWDDAAAIIAVAPTSLVGTTRRSAPRPITPTFLPTAHPLFLALELAQDPSRGREILDQWQPNPAEVARVW